jgi:hypothetical protein
MREQKLVDQPARLFTRAFGLLLWRRSTYLEGSARLKEILSPVNVRIDGIARKDHAVIR